MQIIQFRPYFRLLLAASFFLQLISCKPQFLFEQKDERPMPADSIFLKIKPGYEYVIRKDDKLNISVWNNDDISVGSIYGIYNSGEGYGKWLMVDAVGQIAIPQIGDVKVEGLTIAQAKELVRERFAVTIVNPVIDIKVLNKDVSVLGEVKAPGKIHLGKESNSLLDVLAQAGDFDLYGDKSKIKVVRVVNNEPHSIVLDLTKMQKVERNNIQILPGDIVYVIPRKSKEWDKRAGNTIIPAASAITAALLIFKTFF